MKNKKVISFIIIAIITVIVLYLSLKDHYDVIINSILGINKIWLLLSFVFLFGYYILRSLSISTLAKNFNKEYTFKDAFRLILETNFFHAITPFASGGQPYEMYALNKKNIKLSDCMSIATGDFIVYQIALVLLGIIALASNSIFKIIDNGFIRYLVNLGFIVNTIVIISLFVISLSKKLGKMIANFCINILHGIRIIKDKEKLQKKFHDYIHEFNSGSKILYKNKTNFILLIISQFVALALFYLVPFCLLIGMGINHIYILKCIIIMAYVMLVGSFVPIPGGTGGLEYAFVIFFGKYITGPIINGVMLLWRFITYYFGMILGAILLNVKEDKK